MAMEYIVTRLLFSTSGLIMLDRAINATREAHLGLAKIDYCNCVDGHYILNFAEAVKDGDNMAVAVDRLSDVRYLNREAGLICLSRSEIDDARLSALLRRLRINGGRIIACRLTAITSNDNRLRPIIPVIFVGAVLSEVSEVFNGRFFRRLSLLNDDRFLTVEVLLLTVLRLTVVVVPLAVLLGNGLTNDTIRNGLRILA